MHEEYGALDTDPAHPGDTWKLHLRLRQDYDIIFCKTTDGLADIMQPHMKTAKQYCTRLQHNPTLKNCRFLDIITSLNLWFPPYKQSVQKCTCKMTASRVALHIAEQNHADYTPMP